MITAIQHGQETFWVDTTAEVAPFRLLYPNLRKKQALLIPDNAPARLETTPAEPPFTNKFLLEVEGKLDDFGELKGRSHWTLRGDEELYWRAIFRKTPKSDWKRLSEDLPAPNGRGGEVTDIRPSDPGATEKPFEVEYDFTLPDFLSDPWRKTSFRLPLPRFSFSNADPDKREGSKPIELGSPSDFTLRLKLSLSARYRIRPPVPVTVTRDYAEYRSIYKLEGNTLSTERSLRWLMREIPASRTKDYLAFCASVRADWLQTVWVEADADSLPSIPESMKESMNVEELVRAGRVFVESEKYAMGEELLRRALAKEPANKLALSSLVFALSMQGKDDAEIEFLREWIKIDPLDAHPYSMLGSTLRKQGKYEEAEAVYRRLIEISPLDESAHGDLGLVLVELGKYKEAISEIEKAISLDHDEVDSYQMGLGRAYANLGQPEKTAEAFDRAVKRSPEPETWNNVAYYLSLSNLHLDKAQKYAELAVNSVAAELRNAKLSSISSGQLSYLNDLGTYWGTLGWAHFKKGNLDLAEKYVMASWLFTQLSEAGDHLGQISEKRGEKDEAVRWYALAAAGNRPAPESRENLTRLAGKDKVESLLGKAKAELAEFHTIKLKPLLKDEKEKLEAEFYIVAVPESGRFAKITGARFIRGAEKLRPMAAAFKGAKYPMVFPDKTVTKLFRDGMLTCQPQNGGCSFVLSPLEESTKRNRKTKQRKTIGVKISRNLR
jgi:tetratricopeptide (TPR) repeat protein